MSHPHGSASSAATPAAHSHGHGRDGAGEPFTASLERMNRFQEPEARRIIADLALPAGSRGLDAGCGVGLYALWLAEAIGPAGRVLGIEPDPARADTARETVGGALSPGRLEFRVGDATALDLPDASLDWVWCGDVLHHILDTDRALREFRRVVHPGGTIAIKESQLLSAMFLPGHPSLERRVQLAEIQRTVEEGGGRSFQERRQTTLPSLRAAGLTEVSVRSYLLERRAPLRAADRDYIQKTVFDRNWGERLRDLLAPGDLAELGALCDPASPRNLLASPDYLCLYPITVFAGVVPG